jgi:hypothetical protein
MTGQLKKNFRVGGRDMIVASEVPVIRTRIASIAIIFAGRVAMRLEPTQRGRRNFKAVCLSGPGRGRAISERQEHLMICFLTRYTNRHFLADGCGGDVVRSADRSMGFPAVTEI